MVPRYPSEQEVALETGLPRWNRALRSLLGILFLDLLVWGLAGDGLLDNPMKTWQVASGLYFGHTKRSPTRCSYAIPADSCDELCAGLSARHQRYRSLCPL